MKDHFQEDIAAMNKARHKDLQNTATEAERLLGQYFQYLAFIGSPQELTDGRPNEFEVGPVYLSMARQALSETHIAKFMKVFIAADTLQHAERMKHKLKENLYESKP